MQSRHFLITSFVCVGLLAGTPILAHASPQSAAPQPQAQTNNPAPPPMTRDERDAQRTIPGAYRLTYTLTQMDGSRKIGSQHYTLALDADASPAHIRLESRIPIFHAKTNSYADSVHVAISLNSRLRKFQNGLELNTGIDQTALAENPKAAPYTTDQPPLTRESEVYSTVLMQENQPVVLVKLDIPGSTHIQEVQVELTRVR